MDLLSRKQTGQAGTATLSDSAKFKYECLGRIKEDLEEFLQVAMGVDNNQKDKNSPASTDKALRIVRLFGDFAACNTSAPELLMSLYDLAQPEAGANEVGGTVLVGDQAKKLFDLAWKMWFDLMKEYTWRNRSPQPRDADAAKAGATPTGKLNEPPNFPRKAPWE
jgi:hypothetical protein